MACCHWEFECEAGTRFEIELRSGPMNVLLMDGPNFTAYCDGLECYAFGRYYDVTPVVLQAPHEGYWCVVVDNGNEEELGDIDAYVQAL
ncbi:DUF1883 domain-containing protein [Amycolatopsis sp. NBC_01307]|nr:DUF1883 domain-containing protein [Amycolatopsis sp. NBC_01307]